MIPSSPKIARVLMDLSLDRTFDYAVPPELEGKLRIGMRVNVPFGTGSPRMAYVVSFAETSPYPDLKNVLSVCEDQPGLSDNLLKLAQWMAEYYCCARELAVRNLLPGAVRGGKIRKKTRDYYFAEEYEKTVNYLREHARSKSKCNLLKALLLHKGGVDSEQLLREAGCSKSILNDLIKEGLIVTEKRAVERHDLSKVEIIRSEPKTPNAEQAKALELIEKTLHNHEENQPHTILLHGVTGSGKTEVYLQTIAKVLETGKESIVLVPEISLTPQTVGRFRERFGDLVSVLHSGLSDGERYDEWMKVHEGRVKICVGARSALFAPFRNLGLIVVDEEHDSSYKQSEAPRYNARDVAVMRGKLEHALVILGSATPSVESYYNALSGKYLLSKLLKRSDPTILMPNVKVVDMRMESKDGKKLPFLSQMLIEGVRSRITRGEQSIIFLNRRGYARQMMCDLCGYVAMCPECSVPYTYHRKTQLLTCHLCGSSMDAPAECPNCGSTEIRFQGVGTERIENLSFEVFRGAHIARMDSDTMTRPSAYEKVLSAFRRGEYDILIGTQMIAKGLDFPNVTFVGVVNADMGLYVPGDFRAQERAFQLLTQVAGRAGRGGIPGEVLIQTCVPFNPCIQFASEHDYEGFYKEEIMIREELQYPPYGHMMLIHFNGEDPDKVLACAKNFMEQIRPAIDPSLMISEPAPAPVERIKGKYRFLASFRGTKLAALRHAIRNAVYKMRHPGVEIQVDMDAISMM